MNRNSLNPNLILLVSVSNCLPGLECLSLHSLLCICDYGDNSLSLDLFASLVVFLSLFKAWGWRVDEGQSWLITKQIEFA